MVAPDSTRVESEAADSTAVDSTRADSSPPKHEKALQAALCAATATLRRMGIRAGLAESWLRKALEALRAADKLSPTADDLIKAALRVAAG